MAHRLIRTFILMNILQIFDLLYIFYILTFMMFWDNADWMDSVLCFNGHGNSVWKILVNYLVLSISLSLLLCFIKSVKIVLIKLKCCLLVIVWFRKL